MFSAVILPLAAVVLGATGVLAQDESVKDFPLWVTNDYDCVIGCLQVFNETVTARPSPEMELSAYGCIYDKCNKDTMSMNMYQSSYIIQMFYATGSIYEDPNMGTWGSGTPPKTDSLPPPGESQGAGGEAQSTSSATSQTDGATATSTPTSQSISDAVTSSATSSVLSTAVNTSTATSGFGQDLAGQKGGAGAGVAAAGWISFFAGFAAALISVIA